MNQKSNVFDIENSRVELAEKTSSTSSVNQKVFLSLNYFQKILATSNQNFIQAFLNEFLNNYLSCISMLNVSDIYPDFTIELITYLKDLSNHFPAINCSLNINSEIERIEICYNKLVSIMVKILPALQSQKRISL